MPPFVANIRREVCASGADNYDGASPTNRALLHHRFDTEHLLETAASTLPSFRYYFAQREAVESAIFLYEVRGRSLRRIYFGSDVKETVSVLGPPGFMDFIESIQSEGVTFERVSMADGAPSAYTPDLILCTTDCTIWLVETKGREELDLPQKVARLRQWCADATTTADATLAEPARYDFVFVDRDGFEKHPPAAFAGLAAAFTEYRA